MGRMGDLARQQHAPVIPVAWRGGIHRTHGEKGIFKPMLQPWNQRADPSAHVERRHAHSPSFRLSGAPALFSPLSIGSFCARSEEHTSELQSLMRISYAVFCLK